MSDNQPIEAPFKISIEPGSIDHLPLGSFKGSIVVVESLDKNYREGIEYLSSQQMIGFDTESRPTFSPGQHPYGTSLLQLSGPERAYLFRVKKIGLPEELRSLLSNPSVLKIGAAVHDDIHGLQKISNFTPGGFIDLQQIAWEWGVRDKSVKKMAAIILGVRISKTQQLSNWEAPALSASQSLYAATDAWVCRDMYLTLLSSPKHPLTADQMHPTPIPPLEKDGSTAVEAGIKAASSNSVKAKKKKKKKKKKTESGAAAGSETAAATKAKKESRPWWADRKKKKKEGAMTGSDS